MIITPLNTSPIKYNSKLSRVENRRSGAVSDSFSFTGSFGILKNATRESLQNISCAYDDIMSYLARKSDVGMENLEKNYGDFSYKKGMVFHNCGKDGVSIAVRKPEGKDFYGLMRILVRKGNTFFKEKIVLESFMIKDSNKLVKDFDRTHLNYFSKENTYMSAQEIADSGANEKLDSIIEDLDFAMLKFRKYLIKNKDVDVKIPDFVMDRNFSDNLEDLKNLQDNLSVKLGGLPKKVGLSAKNSFGDYELTSGQSAHKFKNIGDEKLKMNLTTFNNIQHGKFTRLMVYDEDDKALAGYLITPEGKFVANFNHEYPAVIPPKLIMLNEDEAKTVIPQFGKHLAMLKEKVSAFHSHIDLINAKRSERLEEIAARKVEAETKKLARANRKEEKTAREPKPPKTPKPPKEPKIKPPKPEKPPKVPKKKPISAQKEYKELMKASLNQLKTSMSEVTDNLDDFKKAMAEIQLKFEEYFEAHK